MPTITRRANRHANLGELPESLGVPASRVCLDPPPGRATKRDLLKHDGAGGKLYEPVERTLVEKAMGFPESHVASQLNRLVGNFVEPHRPHRSRRDRFPEPRNRTAGLLDPADEVVRETRNPGAESVIRASSCEVRKT